MGHIHTLVLTREWIASSNLECCFRPTDAVITTGANVTPHASLPFYNPFIVRYHLPHVPCTYLWTPSGTTIKIYITINTLPNPELINNPPLALQFLTCTADGARYSCPETPTFHFRG